LRGRRRGLARHGRQLTRAFSPRTTEWGLYEVALEPPSGDIIDTMTITEVTPSGLLHPMAFS
jgi:hypothetical protein